MQALLTHGVNDSTLDRFQSVPNVRQSTGNNNTHRVVEIRPLHLFDQRCRFYFTDILWGGGVFVHLFRSRSFASLRMTFKVTFSLNHLTIFEANVTLKVILSEAKDL